MIKRGEKRGILRRGIDPEIGIALLLGPMIYRHVFVSKMGAKGPKDLEMHVADAFLAAYAQTADRQAADVGKSRSRTPIK
jgi:hypothetical protein